MKLILALLITALVLNPKAIAEGAVGGGDGQLVDLQDGSGNPITSTAGSLNANITNSITASNPSVSATGAAVPAQATFVGGTDGTNLRAVKVSSAGVISVDGSATTQPVSGTVTANIGTSGSLALDASVTGLQVSQGSTTSGQKGGLSLGAVTTAAPSYTTGQTSPLSLTTSGLLRTDSSGSTQPISGTVTANQGGAPWSVAGNVASAATDSGNPVKIGGVFNTTTPTFTNGQRGDFQMSARGAMHVAGASAVGSAPIDNPLSVSGVDGGGLKRIFQTDTNGKMQVLNNDTAGTGITSTSLNGKVGLSGSVVGSDAQTVTGTGSALNGDAIASTDVSAYRSIYLQIVVTGTNTTTFQGSNDNFTNVFSVNCQTVAVATTAPATTTAATGLFYCPVQYKQFRARVTAFTSGSSAGTAVLSPLSGWDLGNRSVTLSSVAVTSTSSNVANAVTADRASAATTTTGTSATISPGTGNTAYAVQFNVTANSGTNQTLDLVVQESWDTGTTWFDTYHFERVTTSNGQWVSPDLRLRGNRIRYSWTITGTTPSFTFSVNRVAINSVGTTVHRFFDRTIVPATTNSTSASFVVESCSKITYGISLSAATAAPIFNLQISEDGSIWKSVGNNLAPVSGNLTDIQGAIAIDTKFARLITSTNDAGATLSYAWIRCQ